MDTQEEIDAKRMLAVIEGKVESIANMWKKYNLVFKMEEIEEINDELGQVFLAKWNGNSGSHIHGTGHIPFYTREEAELFIKLVNKKNDNHIRRNTTKLESL